MGIGLRLMPVFITGSGLMLHTVLHYLQSFGVWGLFGSTAIEATSVPFPGALFLLIYGYLMPIGTWQLVLLSAVNSLIYALFSLIPYYIGMKIGKLSKKKLDPQKIEKAQHWFQKYGDWSIALSRPTGFGNYMSYICGLSNISICRYLVFTFIGVFPWNTLLLFIGRQGNLETIQKFLQLLKQGGTIALIVFVLACSGWIFAKKIRMGKGESSPY
jgi:membrane protein DedA with SNARE-associated domain